PPSGPRQSPIEIVAQLRRFIPPGNLSAAGLASYGRLFATSNFGWKPLHHLLHLQVDLPNKLLVIAVGFEGLAEREQVLLTVIADQRLHDGFFTGANTRVPQLRQFMRVAFPSQD